MSDSLTKPYLGALDSLIRTYATASQEERIPDRTAYGVLASARTAVEKIGGKQSYYARQIEDIFAEDWHVAYKAELVIGIVEALRADILNGFLPTFSELIRGELFQSFLDMAEYLCQEGFKDAAAVIAGSALEAHLRQLCRKHEDEHDCDVTYTASDGSVRPKKAEQLNQALGKVAYSMFDQKQVTAWLDLRNSAAHGNYSTYSVQQVGQFIEWLRDFVQRYPA